MENPNAYTFPNSHYADMGEAMSPLVPDRVCELSVECCFLRNDISDKTYQNDKLQSTVNRMKTAVKRGTGTLKTAVELNKVLEAEREKLLKELMTTQKNLMKSESNVCFQAKVIENNRKVIAKLKSPSENSGGKFGKNLGQIMKDNETLRGTVESLTDELFASKTENRDKEARLTKYENNSQQLQKQINTLQNKLTTVQNDLRVEKATVTVLRDKTQQEDMGELSYSNAFIDLENGYEELHTKYETLWADRASLTQVLQRVQDERDLIYAAAKKEGVRIDSLLGERRRARQEEEEEEEDYCDE